MARAPAPPPPSGVESSHKLISFHENSQGGITTVVEAVTRSPGKTEMRVLYSNGKFQGDDSGGEEGAAQAGFALLPSLFTMGFDRALLVGLGTGHGAWTLKRTGYSDVDIAEFLPGIVFAAARQFRHLNGAVLEDPSVHLALEDGRNLLLTRRSAGYDLISIQQTSIWFAGATNLYSREFYQLADQRLKTGGVLEQRVQFHHISPAEIASAVASMRTVFPYVSLWYFGRQGMMIASHHPQVFDPGRLEKLVPVWAALNPGEDAASLAAKIAPAQVLSPPGVERMLDELHPVINTDHNRWIEYSTPRYNSSAFDWTSFNLSRLAAFEPAAGAKVEARQR